ncbi:hypothetical protein [Leptospira weilii]|uniref:Major capsid protein n=1 Tax=Leptospira weilii str. UI 13098 TaxID=1088542 RepID=M6Q2P7_9LEPT|nr:hypothetical protein [Leptospira weilii]EMN89569.1 hypothetical protein LEP1GSC108_3605 [Leptospira weilii str. UI 13098]OMI16478.1 hypothetical protein BUQ74_15295 [Leptospira weilii serovar Heyan]
MPHVKLDNGLVRLDLQAEAYSDAKREGLSMSEFMEKEETTFGYDPETPAGKNLSAFERQLMANDVSIGEASFSVDDFVKASNQSKYLFPEFVNQNIYIGMNMGQLQVKLEDTHSVKTRISQGAARSVAFDIDGSDLTAKKKSKESGSKFPKATIKTQDKAVETSPVGLEIDFTYEALKRMQILKVQNIFQVFGWKLSQQITKEALRVIKNGDGNTGTEAKTSQTVANVWKYSDVVNLLLSADQGVEFTHAVVSKNFLEKMLTDETNFKQFQSMNLLEGYVKTGQVANFFGVNWKTHPDMDDETILTWNKDVTLELYEDSAGQLVESDRFIREQIEASVISYEFAFGKLFSQSCDYKVLGP